MMTGTLPGTLDRNQGSMWSRCSCEIAIAVGENISGVIRCELSGYWSHEAWNVPSSENHGSISSVARGVSSLRPACPSAVTFMARLLLEDYPHAALVLEQRPAATGVERGGARGLSASGRPDVSRRSTRPPKRGRPARG